SRFSEDFVLAGFVDSGFVSAGPLDLSQLPGSLYFATGVGARYQTPVGPIRVDVAYRLPFGPPLPIEGPGTPSPSNACFFFGTTAAGASGAPDGACTFHLSIGEAF